jgi:hypothetical protein
VTKTKNLGSLAAVISAWLLLPAAASAQYVVENLGPGLIAIRASENTVYVGWRLLALQMQPRSKE